MPESSYPPVVNFREPPPDCYRAAQSEFASYWKVTIFILSAFLVFALGYYAHYTSSKVHSVLKQDAFEVIGVSREVWLQAAISVAADEEKRIGHPMGQNQLLVYKKLVEDMFPGASTPADLRLVMGRAMDIARAARIVAGAPPADPPPK